jgi:hypothetical protein
MLHWCNPNELRCDDSVSDALVRKRACSEAEGSYQQSVYDLVAGREARRRYLELLLSRVQASRSSRRERSQQRGERSHGVRYYRTRDGHEGCGQHSAGEGDHQGFCFWGARAEGARQKMAAPYIMQTTV